MMSKKVVHAIFLITFLLSISFVSANSFTDWFNDFFKITGQQTENNTTNTTTITPVVSMDYLVVNGSNIIMNYSKNFNECVHLVDSNFNSVTSAIECNPGGWVLRPLDYYSVTVGQSYKFCNVNNNSICSQLMQLINITYISTTNTTNATTTQNVISCTDSDGGLVYETPGSVTINYSTGGSTRSDDNCFTYVDNSTGATITNLAEHYCDGLEMKRVNFSCPSCTNRACPISSSTTNVTCTNTDSNVNENPGGVDQNGLSNGWNPAIAGTLTLSFSNGTILSFTESCSSDGKVIEYSCSTATVTRYGSSLVNCASGTNCVSGVCVSTNPNLIFGYCKIASSGLSAQSGTILTQSDCNIYCNQVRASNPSYSPTSLVCSFTPSGLSTATILPYNASIIPTNTTSVTLTTTTSSSGSSSGGSGGGGSSGGGGGGGTGFIFGKAPPTAVGIIGERNNIFAINKEQSRITTPQGVEARSQVALQIDENSGKAYAVTVSGDKKEIIFSPDNAQNIAKEIVDIEIVGNIVMKEDNGKVVYNVEATKEVKVFGFIKTKMNVQANVDVTSGEIVNVEKPWWAVFTNFR
ncbi:hypothetical protein HY448_01395 [Candidatus Pacearchaeota archaeon]|nr:hypothetical protein [Candidatus Pacearchaeota archaeon]